MSFLAECACLWLVAVAQSDPATPRGLCFAIRPSAEGRAGFEFTECSSERMQHCSHHSSPLLLLWLKGSTRQRSWAKESTPPISKKSGHR